jgi:hypothetical protein
VQLTLRCSTRRSGRKSWNIAGTATTQSAVFYLLAFDLGAGWLTAGHGSLPSPDSALWCNVHHRSMPCATSAIAIGHRFWVDGATVQSDVHMSIFDLSRTTVMRVDTVVPISGRCRQPSDLAFWAPVASFSLSPNAVPAKRAFGCQKSSQATTPSPQASTCNLRPDIAPSASLFLVLHLPRYRFPRAHATVGPVCCRLLAATCIGKVDGTLRDRPGIWHHVCAKYASVESSLLLSECPDVLLRYRAFTPTIRLHLRPAVDFLESSTELWGALGRRWRASSDKLWSI